MEESTPLNTFVKILHFLIELSILARKYIMQLRRLSTKLPSTSISEFACSWNSILEYQPNFIRNSSCFFFAVSYRNNNFTILTATPRKYLSIVLFAYVFFAVFLKYKGSCKNLFIYSTIEISTAFEMERHKRNAYLKTLFSYLPILRLSD